MNLHEMRQNYSQGGIHEQDMDPDPMVQFAHWLDDATGVEKPDWLEVNAMTLSTTDLSGAVTNRIVLLKGLDEGKFWFFTNYDSYKGQQIDANAVVSLGFYWPHVERQVRIEGVAEKSTRQRSEDYFASRPRGSQLGAWVSQQSSVVPSRESIEQRMTELQQQFENKTIPCPENWGGYGIGPTRFEFWQGRESRLHDRICYERADGGDWSMTRLAP